MANTLAELIVKIGADISEYVDQLGKAQRQMAALGSSLESVGTRMTAAITVPMVGLGMAALNTAGQFEQNQIAFKTMLGSADQARGMLRDLSALAAESPFELADTVTGARRLMAMGVAARDVVPTMKTVGNAVSALGAGSEGLQRVTLAIGQMNAKGKASGEEFRQLSEAGIKAWDYLAKAIGKSVPDAMKAVEQRTVSSATAISAILAGIEKDFSGSMEAQNQTFLGQISNLKDNLTRTLAQIGDALMPTAKSLVQALQPMLDQAVVLARAFADLPPGAQQAAIGFGLMAAAMGPLLLVSGAMMSSAAQLVKLFMLLGGSAAISAATNFVAMGGAMAALQVSVVGVAAAFAAWELGGWLRNNIPLVKQFGDSLADLIGKWTGLYWIMDHTGEKAQEAVRHNAQLESSVAGLERSLKDRGVTMTRGNETLEVYSQRLLEAAKSAGPVIQKTQELGTETEKTHAKVKTFSEHILRAQLERITALQAEGDHAIITARELAVFYDMMINGADAAADLTENLKLSIPVLVDVDGAFRALGVTSSESLQKTAEIAIDSYKVILASGTATAHDLLAAWIKMEEAVQAATIARGEVVLAVDRITLDDAKRKLAELDGEVKTTSTNIKSNTSKAMQAVSTVVTDLSRGIADAIIHAKNLGDVFKKVADDIVTAILRTVIEKGINELIKKLATVGGMWGKLGGILGGGATSAAGSAAGAAGSAAGSAAGGIGSSAGSIGSAAGGLVGIVGAVGSVVGAVSSIIGNFQMMGMNKSLDLIEHNTRFAQIGLIGPGGVLETLLNYLPGVRGIQDRLADVRGALFDPVAKDLEGIYNRIGGGSGGGGAVTVGPFNFYGVTNPRDMAESVVREMRLAGVRL